MHEQLRLSRNVMKLLCCPVCHSKLQQNGDQFKCTSSTCAKIFPIIDGIPVIINEETSVFPIDFFISHHKTFFSKSGENKLYKTIRNLIPKISKNIKGKSNFNRLRDILLWENTSPKVLVIGGSILGQNINSLIDDTGIEFTESDVSFGPRTMLICDAHDIPFEDRSFDGVIVQAVLEHVVDPYRCCEEIYRVLKDRGVVYAETPFMQQVHGGCYDFTRFTYLGHRRLFRKFEELDSGAVCGPGMALAWSYQYFLLSFTTSKRMRLLLRGFVSLTSFMLKYFDYYLINKPGTLDAASGYYFMGRKSEQILSDHDLIKLYRGQNK